MCGIAGVVALDSRRDVGAPLERLTAALSHRGPDGSGFQFLRGRWAAFGHRRLSIVDLAGGAQPMSNEDGKVWVVLNGELYNHLELRRELESLGHQFRTQADTEVLVHGWEEWGSRLLNRLNGMYAFALFDGRSDPGEIFLVRDPVGIKPLYLGLSDNVWWFASELASARRVGLVDGGLRPEAFDEYLVYRFVPSPGTFYRQVWKVPPGHLCKFSLAALPRRPEFRSFETRFAPASVPRSAGDWQAALRDTLSAAVKRQLMADVPLGSLLSGGVDSSVVTRLMCNEGGAPPQAFAVGFADGGAWAELPMARAAAQTLGVPLTELAVREGEFLDAWPDQIAALGEPIANSGVLLVGLLCKVVRASRKVVLTGQGADEPLGGYSRHAVERLFPLMRWLRPLLDRLPASFSSSDRMARLQRIARFPDEGRRFAETLAVFSPDEAVRLTAHTIDPEELADPVRRWLPEEGDSLNRLLRVDARLSLADDLLIVADHMSMASSVELRVPFLDLEFLSLVELMPGRYKVSRVGERKWLYRRAVGELLPPELRASLTGFRSRTGRKLGFSTPIDGWYTGWLKRDAEPFLLGAEARVPSYLHVDNVRRVLVDARDHGAPRMREMLALYVLEVWLRGALATPAVQAA